MTREFLLLLVNVLLQTHLFHKMISSDQKKSIFWKGQKGTFLFLVVELYIKVYLVRLFGTGNKISEASHEWRGGWFVSSLNRHYLTRVIPAVVIPWTSTGKLTLCLCFTP